MDRVGARILGRAVVGVLAFIAFPTAALAGQRTPAGSRPLVSLEFKGGKVLAVTGTAVPPAMRKRASRVPRAANRATCTVNFTHAERPARTRRRVSIRWFAGIGCSRTMAMLGVASLQQGGASLGTGRFYRGVMRSAVSGRTATTVGASVRAASIRHVVSISFPGRVRSGLISIYPARGERLSRASSCSVLPAPKGWKLYCQLYGVSFAPLPPGTSGLAAETAKDVLKLLGEAALGVGVDRAFGAILSNAGLEDNSSAEVKKQLDQIESQLDGINQRLIEIQGVLGDLQKKGAQHNCNDVAGKLEQQRAATENVWDDYVEYAGAVANGQKVTTSGKTLKQAKKDLFKEIDDLRPRDYLRFIHNTLSNPAADTDSLITACGQASQARQGRFLTSQSSAQVRAVLDYWQEYEAKLTVLYVEQLRQNSGDKRNDAAKKAVEVTESYLNAEDPSLKQPIPPATVLDSQPPSEQVCGDCLLLWYAHAANAFDRDTAGWEIARMSRNDLVEVRDGRIFHYDLEFQLPSVDELFSLLTGCCNGGTAKAWLAKNARIDWYLPDRFADWTGLRSAADAVPNGGCYPLYYTVFEEGLPLIWTSTDPTDDQAQAAYKCDSERQFVAARYGVVVPLGLNETTGKITVDDLRSYCDTQCGYPLGLPAAALGVHEVKTADYVY